MPLNITPIEAASEVILLIDEAGTTVTLPGGGTAKCIVDENPERIAREMPQELEGKVEGRPALFDFKPDAAVTAGDLVTYDGAQWTMHPPRSFKPGNVRVQLTFLGTSGGVR